MGDYKKILIAIDDGPTSEKVALHSVKPLFIVPVRER